MANDIPEKYLDRRTRERYLKKGLVSPKEFDQYLKALPNDEGNFELASFIDDELGVGDELSEEELENLPPIREEDINDFEFLKDKKES